MMYNIRMLDILIAREEECNQELDSDDTIAQFCVLHHPAIMCPIFLISTKLVIGMGNEYGKYSAYTYTYLPAGHL